MDVKVKEQIYKSGFEFEKQYGGCAQCTLCALQPYLDIDPAVIKSATGLMAISAVTGRSPENMGDKQAVADTAVLCRKLYDRFMAEYGSVLCRDIQYKIMGKSYRMYDPEDMQRFLDDGGHDDKCTAVVAKAAVWVAEILEEAGIREFK